MSSALDDALRERAFRDCDDRDHGEPPAAREIWTCPCGWSGEGPERELNGFGCTIGRTCPDCGCWLYGKQEIE